MKNVIPTNLIFGVIIGGLVITNAITVGAFFWQRAEWNKLRLQLAQSPPAATDAKPGTASAPSKSLTEARNAVWSGDLPRLKALLDRQPDLLNQAPENGSTLLHEAAHRGRNAMVVELLRRKANPSLVNIYRGTALHSCVEGTGDREIALMLVESGSDLTIRNRNGKTPLGLAMAKKRPELIEALREAGGQE